MLFPPESKTINAIWWFCFILLRFFALAFLAFFFINLGKQYYIYVFRKNLGNQ